MSYDSCGSGLSPSGAALLTSQAVSHPVMAPSHAYPLCRGPPDACLALLTTAPINSTCLLIAFDAWHAGGDPFLAALYRRWDGAVDMLQDVTVSNHIGGVQRTDKPYTAPRYSRCSISKEAMLQQLHLRTLVLERAWATVTAAASVSGSFSNGRAGLVMVAAEHPAPKAAYKCEPDLLMSFKACLEPCGPHAGTVSHDASDGIAAFDAPGNGISSSSSSSNSGSRRPVSSPCADAQHATSSADLTTTTGWRRQLAVDVLVPTARVDVELLQGIAHAVL